MGTTASPIGPHLRHKLPMRGHEQSAPRARRPANDSCYAATFEELSYFEISVTFTDDSADKGLR
jgi:hypothetical protein